MRMLCGVRADRDRACIRISRTSRSQPNRTDVLIEQVRDLIAQLGTRPSRGPIRVAIIDDAETLNVPAQNALLKTLEEPPGHAIIFMITASERALLDTIRSRTATGAISRAQVADLEADPRRARRGRQGARGSASRCSRAAAPPATRARRWRRTAGEGTARGAQQREVAGLRAGASRSRRHSLAIATQAADNFELIARLLEEILCCKLLKTDFAAASADDAANDDSAGRADRSRGAGELYRGGSSRQRRRSRRWRIARLAGRKFVDDRRDAGGARLSSESWRTSIHFESVRPPPTIVAVSLQQTGHLFNYLAGDFALKRGDRVLVESDAGARVGTVEIEPHEPAQTLDLSAMRPIIRLVTTDDLRIEEET